MGVTCSLGVGLPSLRETEVGRGLPWRNPFPHGLTSGPQAHAGAR